MSLRTPSHAPGRDRHNPGSPSRRPAVVETDSPQSISDGRATGPTPDRRAAGSAASTGASATPVRPPVLDVVIAVHVP
jgi:hypothetical protein